jgi:hypothetical protein
MLALIHLLFVLVYDRFKSRRRLEIENLYLRHQLNIAIRKAPQRLRLRGTDRATLGSDQQNAGSTWLKKPSIFGVGTG